MDEEITGEATDTIFVLVGRRGTSVEARLSDHNAVGLLIQFPINSFSHQIDGLPKLLTGEIFFNTLAVDVVARSSRGIENPYFVGSGINGIPANNVGVIACPWGAM